MRFIQFSDVHLDSFVGGSLRIDSATREILRDDLRASLIRACALALEREADIVLIPGDLFDYERFAPAMHAFLVDSFERIAPTPVFISPGNHDSIRPGSPYAAGSGFDWPDNVHIFSDANFSTVALSEHDISVTSIAHAHRGNRERLPSENIVRNRAKFDILMLHGSRDGYAPSQKENIIPFSDDELLAHGFTYAALGHYHSFAEIRNAGKVRAAYSGCLMGRGLDEAGAKCAIVGEISESGEVAIEQVEVAPRRIVCADVSVTGLSSVQEIAVQIEQCGARECDIVHIRLAGMLSSSIDIPELARALDGRFFHIVLNDSALTPDYDIEAMDGDSLSVRGAFVRRIREMESNASTAGERTAIRHALFHGLAALDGITPEARDAD